MFTTPDLTGSNTNAVGMPQPQSGQRGVEDESVVEPPSVIDVSGRTEDMTCASSVTTHFQDAQLFIPHMYPSAQNLHDTEDVDDPQFQPVTQQPRGSTTTPPPSLGLLPPLQEESSSHQEPTDESKIDENRILKEQEKAVKKEESATVPSLASLESRINQKNQIYCDHQISSTNKTDGVTIINSSKTKGGQNHPCIGFAIQEGHPVSEDEVAKKIDNEDEQGVIKVLDGLGQNKDAGLRNPAITAAISSVNEDSNKNLGILDARRNPVVSVGISSSVDENNWHQDVPGAQDVPPPGNTASVPGAHPVSNPFGNFSQRQANLSTRGENQGTAVDEEEGGDTQPPPPESLAEARPVAEDDLPIATADHGNQNSQKRSNWPFYIMEGIFCILVMTAVVVGAVCGTGHCSQKIYVDGSSTMAPTTIRDAVAAPEIEIALKIILGKEYFQHVEGSGEGNDGKILEFMLETRHKAFDWIVNQDPIQLEYNSPNLVQRFLLALFYYQTTRHQRWKECNPPATPQGSTFCYEPDIVTGEATSTIWGDLWLSASHECQWAGVACETVQSKEMTVVGLKVLWNHLNGPLPWEISQLPHLKSLDLHGNMLSGMLPPKLLSFSLERLWLGNNQLSGPIPARWFENLHDATTIPSEVGMPPLKTLRLGNNSLTGSLPLDLFHLGSLGSLFVDQNDLTGTLPSEIGLLTHLQLIFLSHTGIGGTLPSEIGLATKLTEFRAAYSNMEGTLPEAMYTGLTDFAAFVGNDCNFSGTISSSLGRLTGLQWLGLANNNFDGTIPNEIEALTTLRRLLVNGNQLTGTVPVSVCENLDVAFEVAVVADCLPNPGTGVPTIGCGDDCCTSCCDETGVCLDN